MENSCAWNLCEKIMVQPFPKLQILDSSKLKDDNFEFDENGGMFAERVENAVGKGEIAH